MLGWAGSGRHPEKQSWCSGCSDTNHVSAVYSARTCGPRAQTPDMCSDPVAGMSDSSQRPCHHRGPPPHGQSALLEGSGVLPSVMSHARLGMMIQLSHCACSCIREPEAPTEKGCGHTLPCFDLLCLVNDWVTDLTASPGGFWVRGWSRRWPRGFLRDRNARQGCCAEHDRFGVALRV